MNKKNKEFGEVVSIRLSEQEKENLDKLCQALNTTKSEFLRNRVLSINQTIIGISTMNNLSNKLEIENNLQQLTGYQSVFAKGKADEVKVDGETPADTTEGLVDQLKNRKE